MLSKSVYDYLILLLLAFIWGSSFILIKKGLVALSPYQVAAVRICITALCFLPFVIAHWKEIDWSKLWLFLLVGLTGTALPSVLFPLAQTEISSSLSGILNSLTPIFTFTIGIQFFRQPLNKKSLVGLLIAFIGVVLLFLQGQSSSTNGNILFGLFAIIGTICYALNVNCIKQFFQKTRALIISAVSFTMVGPIGLGMLLVTNGPQQIMTHEDGMASLGYVTLLAVFSTVISTVIFFRLVQKTNPVFAASVSYVTPVIAIFWGILDGEFFSWEQLISVALILSGVYMIKR